MADKPSEYAARRGLGDDIEIRPAGRRKFEVARDSEREWALKTMRRIRRPLPPGFKFDREEIHERR